MVPIVNVLIILLTSLRLQHQQANVLVMLNTLTPLLMTNVNVTLISTLKIHQLSLTNHHVNVFKKMTTTGLKTVMEMIAFVQLPPLLGTIEKKIMTNVSVFKVLTEMVRPVLAEMLIFTMLIIIMPLHP
jgi:Na+/H+ antiporter NhaC